MEISQLKKSVQDFAKILGAMVEDKLGERSQLEEQVRKMAEALSKRVGAGASKVTVRVKRLEHFKGDLPKYATPGASGLDVRACLDEPVVVEPGHRVLIPTGLSLEIPQGYEVQVRPRSGLAISRGISLVNTPGTVDADYRGELKVILINLGQETVHILDQERIAQLVVAPVVQAELEEVSELGDTERGSGGFGSTGV